MDQSQETVLWLTCQANSWPPPRTSQWPHTRQGFQSRPEQKRNTKWQKKLRKNIQGKIWGIFGFFLFMYYRIFNTASSDSPESEDAGIEPRTVATLAPTVRRSIPKRLDLIHISAISHSQSTRSHPHSARSHSYSAIFFLTNCSYFVVGSESRARICKPAT